MNPQKASSDCAQCGDLHDLIYLSPTHISPIISENIHENKNLRIEIHEANDASYFNFKE